MKTGLGAERPSCLLVLVERKPGQVLRGVWLEWGGHRPCVPQVWPGRRKGSSWRWLRGCAGRTWFLAHGRPVSCACLPTPTKLEPKGNFQKKTRCLPTLPTSVPFLLPSPPSPQPCGSHLLCHMADGSVSHRVRPSHSSRFPGRGPALVSPAVQALCVLFAVQAASAEQPGPAPWLTLQIRARFSLLSSRRVSVHPGSCLPSDCS